MDDITCMVGFFNERAMKEEKSKIAEIKKSLNSLSSIQKEEGEKSEPQFEGNLLSEIEAL